MRKVYLNHDGGVDDLVSLYLLLKMEDVELVGSALMKRTAIYYQRWKPARRLFMFGSEKDKQLKVKPSDSRPVNPFPKEWRMHALQ